MTTASRPPIMTTLSSQPALSETLPGALTYRVDVTEERIALGGPGAYANPISLALAEALGLPLVGVGKGPSVTPIYDARTSPGAYEMMTTWNAVLAQLVPCSSPEGQPRSKDWAEVRMHDVPLPRRCQYFLNAWGSGPRSGPWAIRSSTGQITARLTYCDLICPFAFDLTLAFVPGSLQATSGRDEILPDESDRTR